MTEDDDSAGRIVVAVHGVMRPACIAGTLVVCYCVARVTPLAAFTMRSATAFGCDT
jgi:hypothetical protein